MTRREFLQKLCSVAILLPTPATDAELLARLIYTESRGEPEAGKYAVGHVVLNRLDDGRYGNTLRAVMLAPYQFYMGTWYNTECMRVAIELMAGNHPENTYGALYFHADYVYPYWAAQRTYTVTIGRHLFYR